MLTNVKVAMPDKNIYFITRGKKDTIYVYYVLKAYRNNKNQPTNDAVIIGKKDPQSGKLIPNDNYFDIFDCEVTIKVKGRK